VVNADGGFQSEHESEPIVPITTLQATTTIDRNRYGNSCTVLVDADWTEDATVTHQETEIGVGVTRVVTKLGERPISAVTSYEDGSGVTESWVWDAEGSLVEYETVETSTENSVTVEEITTLQHWDVTENGIEHTQTVTVRQNYDPYSQWSNVPGHDAEREQNDHHHQMRRGGEFVIRVYEEIYTYNPTPGPGLPEWELWEKAYKTGVPDATGLVGSSVAKYYRYVIDPVEGEWWALNRTERAVRSPAGHKQQGAGGEQNRLAFFFKRHGRRKHFRSGRTGAGIRCLRAFDNNRRGTAAAKFLAYCQRAHTATVDVPLQPFCIGDFVSWKGERWTVEQVTWT
jgi:YD repeat-containing protein